MKKIAYTIILLFGVLMNGFSQNINSVFRGIIKDSKNEQPIVGATVHIFNNQFSNGDVTDASGNFKITDVAIGRFEVEVNFLGYNTLVLSEVLIEAGKEQVMDIYLEESISDLQEITVKANSRDYDINPLSNHLITIEEVKRFPATFFDPARLAMLYPGVTGTNDQANGLSIRGLPPSLLQWRLEGVEIVNPNHLSNAGTISDQPSVAAGGVNILSAQMLDNSRLYTGAFPIEYSNALGGVMDMRLRKGNNQQHEFTAQAGLLGFDLGMEGPFSKKSKASFLFNYRYSFTGLLTNFGVDFDGESIGFEDVSFNLNFPTEKAGDFMVFGIGGKSDNFKKRLPMKEWEVDKDRNQIEFDSKVGIGGVKHQIGFRNVFVKTIVAYSGLKDRRRTGEFNEFQENGIKRVKLSLNHEWQVVVSKKGNLTLGIQYLKDKFTNCFFNESSILSRTEGRNDNLFGGYLKFEDIWFRKLIVNTGLHTSYKKINSFLDFREKSGELSLVRPSFSLKLPIDKKASLNYAFSVNEGILPISFKDDGSNLRIVKNSYIESHNLGYELFYLKKYRIKAVFFHQEFHNIPIVKYVLNGRNFSGNLSNLNPLPFINYRNSEGQQKSKGLELSLQKDLLNKSYYLFSATLFQATYRNNDDKDVLSRYSNEFAFNYVFGTEFKREKKNKIKIWGFNIRSIFRGGFRERSLAIVNAGQLGVSSEFDNQLPPYFRVDLNCYLKINKVNKTSTLSLDIQNATNHQNVAYNYFDTFSREIKTQYQLGLIPILNYRIEF